MLKSTISVLIFFQLLGTLFCWTCCIRHWFPPLPTSNQGHPNSLHGPYDVSQTLDWYCDSHHTLFESALPITSDSWLQSFLAWASNSPPELKNDFSFIMSTGTIRQEFTGIPWLWSSACRQNCHKEEFHLCPKREWASSVQLSPSPCNLAARRSPPPSPFLLLRGFCFLFLFLLFRGEAYFYLRRFLGHFHHRRHFTSQWC